MAKLAVRGEQSLVRTKVDETITFPVSTGAVGINNGPLSTLSSHVGVISPPISVEQSPRRNRD